MSYLLGKSNANVSMNWEIYRGNYQKIVLQPGITRKENSLNKKESYYVLISSMSYSKSYV